MAEGLHDHVGREAEAGQVLELVAGHGAGGVLRTDGGHLGLAVGTGADALAFGQADGAADHLLRQGVALAGILRDVRQAEEGGGRQAEGLAGLGGEAAADDQVDAAAGANLVEDHGSLELGLGDQLAVLEGRDLGSGMIDPQLDLVAHVHL
ncbi:hypothetical protein D3C86_520610 [compost metagenome]